MPLRSLTNIEIQKYYKNKSKFKGVYILETITKNHRARSIKSLFSVVQASRILIRNVVFIYYL